MPPIPSGFAADDGCGIAHYPSGTVAALVTKVNGFKYFAFYDPNEGKPVAAFTQGVGFVHWGARNSAPHFVAKVDAAYECDREGEIAREWSWERNGKPVRAIAYDMRDFMRQCVERYLELAKDPTLKLAPLLAASFRKLHSTSCT